MTLNNFEKRAAMGHFFRRISSVTFLPFNLTAKFGRITHVGRSVFLGVNYAPIARKQRPRRNPVSVYSLLFIHTPFDAELPRGGVYLGSATPPILRERCFSAPQFLGFSCIYAYTL